MKDNKTNETWIFCSVSNQRCVAAGPPVPPRGTQQLPASLTSSIGGDSAAGLTAEEVASLPAEQRAAVLQRALAMAEQYKRSRDKLLQEVNLQSMDLERAQMQSSVLTTSLQVCRLSLS